MANLYDKAQYIFVAGANKSGSIYGLQPIAGTSNVTLVSSSTFRASSGSRINNNGIIEGVAPNILRVDYSDLVTCPSYKLEPQRTNFQLASDYLNSGSSATPTNNWVTASFIKWSLVSEPTSPLGTGLSGLITEDTTNNVHVLRSQPVNISTRFSQSYTISVYAKQAGTDANQRNIALQGVSATSAQASTVFILQGTGSISGTAKLYVSGAYIEPLPNGWYRCSQLVYNAGQSMNFRIILTSGSTFAESYTGNGSGSVYVVGAQLETGSITRDLNTLNISSGTYLTSYISTSTGSGGAIATRNADRSITLPAPVNNTNWTAFLAYKRYAPDPLGNSFDMYISSGSGYAAVYANGRAIWNSGSAGGPTGSFLQIGVENKIAMRLSGSQMSWFINGSRFQSIPWSGTGTWGNLIIGDQSTNSDLVQPSSFYVRVAAMFSQSLSDAECQQLTATGSGTV
jgi:hypothetical protein